MQRNASRDRVASWLLVLAGMVLCATAAHAGDRRPLQLLEGPWISVGVGGAAVRSLAPSPAAGREGLAGSIEIGYRFSPQWSMGLDFGAVAPVGGCSYWNCEDPADEFAPNFTRIFAFGEYRLPDSGWRFRASAGVSRFCYSRYWSDSAWNWGDLALTLIDDDYLADSVGGSGAYRCDGRTRAMGGSLSVGYDWAVKPRSPVSMGVRLTAEAANFDATRPIGVPAFRHRAVTLTLHLNLN